MHKDVWQRCLDEARERLIVALDAPTLEEVYRLVEVLGPEVRWFKVGMSAFYAGHRSLLQTIKRSGARIFLDLKLHDIPSTVARTVDIILDLGVSWLTLHALGGGKMLLSARERVEKQSVGERGERLKLFAVTVLTTHDARSWQAIGMSWRLEESTEHLARFAIDAGMDGLICAPTEVRDLASLFGRYPNGPYLVTPGVRLEPDQGSPFSSAEVIPSSLEEKRFLLQDANHSSSGRSFFERSLRGTRDDQVRIATPEKAFQDGAYAVVVGRPIISAQDPLDAYRVWVKRTARALFEYDKTCSDPTKIRTRIR